mgnify:CR=1 FL=1
MIADALRKSILQAAIQGKLTEQLPEDGDARDLLEEIKAEKARLIKEGKTKKERPLPEIREDEIPFDIPENWCWCKIGQVFTLQAGNFISSDSIKTEGEYPCYGGNGLRGYVGSFNRSGRYPLIGRQGALCGNINMADGEFYATEHAVVVQSYCNCFADWAAHFLKALNLNQYATATAQPGLAVSKINQLVFPLPPLAEQHRIVERLSSLLPELDKLENDETKLDFHQKSFPQRMKNSLLQAAIQGKLTEQLESDGYARELVADIQKEKARLIKEGKIKKERALPEIREDEIPFDIPENWCWVRLGELVSVTGGYSFKSTDYMKTGIRVIRISDFDENGFLSNNLVFSSFTEKLTQHQIKKGDILTAMTGGTVGKSYLVKETCKDYYVNQRVALIRSVTPLDPFYVYVVMRSVLIQQIIQESKNSTNDNISLQGINLFYVPLPPLDEQHRIVERLEQLLPLCDALD